MTYIKVFLDLLDALEPFSDDERGRLLTAMLVYASTGEAPALAGNERYIFPILKGQIDRDKADRETISRQNSINGAKGGRPPKAKEPTAFSENRPLFPHRRSSGRHDP